MRIFAVLFAAFALASATPAFARDDIMPPPNPAPRIPVETQALEGSTNGPLTALQKAREAKAAAQAAQPVTALGREVRTKTAAVETKQAKREAAAAVKNSQEVEGKGQALDGERISVEGREIRLFGVVTPALTSSFGPQTRSNLDRMLSNSNVLCKITNVDTDGKPVAFCGTVKVPDLSYEMLRQGWAMVDRRTLKGNSLSEVYEKAEQEAQNQNRGIFAPAPLTMTVPVNNPTKIVMAPAVQPQPAPVAQPSPIVASSAASDLPVPAPEAAAPALEQAAAITPDVQKLSVGNEAEAAPVNNGVGFVERYQILIGACILMGAACIFGFFLMWRERKILIEKRRALAAALRGELMSARLICRTRARELLTIKKTDIEAKHPGQLWPRVRSIVYQAHVSHLGLLGAELARQVASVYGQCSDYAAYYQSNSVRMPIPQVVGETLSTLAEHMDTLMYGLQEVETTGKALIGEDIMAEEEQRAAAENVRLAVAAAHKRALPPPTVNADSVKAAKQRPIKQPAPQPQSQAQAAVAALEETDKDEEDEPAAEKDSKSPRVA